MRVWVQSAEIKGKSKKKVEEKDSIDPDAMTGIWAFSFQTNYFYFYLIGSELQI